MDKTEIIFKCEGSMWQMLADGTKTWDARRYDISDDRITRLYWWHAPGFTASTYIPLAIGRWESWEPDEPFVSFLNKQTGETLKFRYRGMEFAPWAPGWTFLILGELVSRS